MSDIVGGILQKQFGGMPEMNKQQLRQTQNDRSFESILQNGGAKNETNSQVQSTNQINDPRLESMRVDLMERYQNLPEGVPKVTTIFPEYLDTKTRMSAFRDALNKAVGSTGQGTDVKGRFSQVEDEWLKLENVMRSDKELSQGELLGLQARLYQVSQHIDVLSKVVDQMTSGVKTILNTNV